MEKIREASISGSSNFKENYCDLHLKSIRYPTPTSEHSAISGHRSITVDHASPIRNLPATINPCLVTSDAEIAFIAAITKHRIHPNEIEVFNAASNFILKSNWENICKCKNELISAGLIFNKKITSDFIFCYLINNKINELYKDFISRIRIRVHKRICKFEVVNIIFNKLAELKDKNQIIQIHQSLINVNLIASIDTNNKIMEIFAKENDYNSALVIFNKIKYKDSRAYCNGILSYLKTDRLFKAERFFSQLCNIQEYNTNINLKTNYIAKQQNNERFYLSRKLQKDHHKISPNKFVFYGMIEAYVKVGVPNKAMEVFNKMIRFDIDPPLNIINMLISICENTGEFTHASNLLNMAIKYGYFSETLGYSDEHKAVDLRSTSIINPAYKEIINPVLPLEVIKSVFLHHLTLQEKKSEDIKFLIPAEASDWLRYILQECMRAQGMRPAHPLDGSGRPLYHWLIRHSPQNSTWVQEAIMAKPTTSSLPNGML